LFADFDAVYEIELLKTTRVLWAKTNLKSIKLAFLWGKKHHFSYAPTS